MNWVESGGGYALALDGARLVCRNSKGKVLASVPKAVRKSETGVQLLELRDWLVRHAQECQATVERWMLHSLPVPLAVLQEVWPDPDWRAPLLNLLVQVDEQTSGFLRDVRPERGLGLVDIDGESLWVPELEQVVIPHPIRVSGLADYREVLTELSLEQQVVQLFRECWELPAESQRLSSVNSFAGGRFELLLHAHGRARGLGYQVRGGYACCPVWQEGDLVEARFWIGSEAPEAPTETGELLWVDSQERPLSAAAAGAVAYSEGMRMASSIYAGRVVEQEQRP
jgi:hypothetical protein